MYDQEKAQDMPLHLIFGPQPQCHPESGFEVASRTAELRCSEGGHRGATTPGAGQALPQVLVRARSLHHRHRCWPHLGGLHHGRGLCRQRLPLRTLLALPTRPTCLGRSRPTWVAFETRLAAALACGQATEGARLAGGPLLVHLRLLCLAAWPSHLASFALPGYRSLQCPCAPRSRFFLHAKQAFVQLFGVLP